MTQIQPEEIAGVLENVETWFLGVVPGVRGVLAFIPEEGSEKVAVIVDLPFAGRDIDVKILGSCLLNLPVLNAVYESTSTAFVSKQAMPALDHLLHLGELKGTLRTLGIDLSACLPSAWKRIILLDSQASRSDVEDYCKDYKLIYISETKKLLRPEYNHAVAICLALLAKQGLSN